MRAKIFCETNLDIGLRAEKNLGLRAHAWILKIFQFFKNGTFSIHSRTKVAQAREEVDQLQNFFQIFNILYLNKIRAKFHLLTPNRKKVRGGMELYSILYCFSFWAC